LRAKLCQLPKIIWFYFSCRGHFPSVFRVL